MIQRRALLSATLGGVAAMAVDEGKAWAHSQPMRPRIFVLVHGSWLGGWSWRRVADLLRAQGETVVTLGRVVPGEGVIYTGRLL